MNQCLELKFNGQSEDLDNSLYTILSISLPNQDYSDLLLFNLDLLGNCLLWW